MRRGFAILAGVALLAAGCTSSTATPSAGPSAGSTATPEPSGLWGVGGTALEVSGFAQVVREEKGFVRYAPFFPYDIEIDANDLMWAATQYGAYVWDLKTGTYAQVSPDTRAYWTVTVMPDHSVWFTGLDGGGVSRYDGENWRTFTTADGLPSDNIWEVQKIGADLWFASTGGATVYDGKTYKTYTTADGLATNNLSFILPAPDGSIWFGSGTNEEPTGLSRFDGQKWTKFTVAADGMLDETIMPLGIAADGALWFGTADNGGASRFDGTSWSHFRVSDGLAAPWAESMGVAPDGTLWFGNCTAGITRYDGRTFTAMTPGNGLFPVKNVHGFDWSSDGAMWVAASDEGLVRYIAP
jgi:ligand-binding sensor domain-containing protein